MGQMWIESSETRGCAHWRLETHNILPFVSMNGVTLWEPSQSCKQFNILSGSFEHCFVKGVCVRVCVYVGNQSAQMEYAVTSNYMEK